MDNKRFQVEKASKFEKLSPLDMQSVKGGGLCIKCMKSNDKRWSISLGAVTNADVPLKARHERLSSDTSFINSIEDRF